jgi:hypothetical protein
MEKLAFPLLELPCAFRRKRKKLRVPFRDRPSCDVHDEPFSGVATAVVFGAPATDREAPVDGHGRFVVDVERNGGEERARSHRHSRRDHLVQHRGDHAAVNDAREPAVKRLWPELGGKTVPFAVRAEPESRFVFIAASEAAPGRMRVLAIHGVKNHSATAPPFAVG